MGITETVQNVSWDELEISVCMVMYHIRAYSYEVNMESKAKKIKEQAKQIKE